MIVNNAPTPTQTLTFLSFFSPPEKLKHVKEIMALTVRGVSKTQPVSVKINAVV